MISNLMLIVGVIFLGIACRTLKNSFVRKLGVLSILFASYLIGWLLIGYWEVGLVFVIAWFFLPWIEILTRIRKLRLPIKRTVVPQSPPSRKDFPYLSQLTTEVESLGFEYALDAGWGFEKHSHFFRLFYNSEHRCDASITFIEQETFSFFYISLCSRSPDGRVFISWNYPFSYGLQFPSNFIINRIKKFSPADIYAAHLQFVAKHSLLPETLHEQTPESLLANIQQEMQNLVTLNLKKGLLLRDGDSLFRYSTHGMFFIWLQFLRDMVKFS